MCRLSFIPVLLLVACAPAMQTSTDGSGSTPGSIVGSYSLAITESDLPAGTPQQMRDRAVGTWGLAFHEGNHYVVSVNGVEMVQGSYQASGDQISFATGDTGPYSCNRAATYTWQVSDGQLTFTPVGTDPCMGRRAALTTRPFTRTP